MIEPVYASEGGHRFHKDRACPDFLAAHDLWRFDPMQWVPGMPQIMLTDGHPLHEMTLPDAFGRGKEPCATCYPGLRAALYRGNCEDDFGHWPTRGISLNSLCDDVCQRCTEPGVWYERGVDELTPVHIPWPCTSAIVLGLVERGERAA